MIKILVVGNSPSQVDANIRGQSMILDSIMPCCGLFQIRLCHLDRVSLLEKMISKICTLAYSLHERTQTNGQHFSGLLCYILLWSKFYIGICLCYVGMYTKRDQPCCILNRVVTTESSFRLKV